MPDYVFIPENSSPLSFYEGRLRDDDAAVQEP